MTTTESGRRPSPILAADRDGSGPGRVPGGTTTNWPGRPIPAARRSTPDPIPHRDKPVGGPGQHPLDADDRRPADRREVPVKQMPVKSVHRGRDPARKCGQPPEYTSLGSVRMDHMGAKPANDLEQADERTEVIGRPRRPAQAANVEYRQMGSAQRDIVALPFPNRARRDPLIEAPGVEHITEDSRHQRRATDVQSGDDL